MKILGRMILLSCLIPLNGLSYEEISTDEKLKNFGLVYGIQWIVYVGTQKATIEKNGSLSNWIHYPSSPHFDNDSFDYNLFQHSLSGSAYYLFYRSQDYRRVDALLWSVISSAAFEFTIETVTERPSWQDLYQTPVYGSLLGMGLENISDYFFQKGNWWGRALGYLSNPFRLLNQDGEKTSQSYIPILHEGKIGLLYTREWE